MKTIFEGVMLAAICLYVLYSCSLGVPMVVETYHTLEAYHPKINASEQPIGPIQLEKHE